jgi:hypothetical protein
LICLQPSIDALLNRVMRTVGAKHVQCPFFFPGFTILRRTDSALKGDSPRGISFERHSIFHRERRHVDTWHERAILKENLRLCEKALRFKKESNQSPTE